MKQQINSSIQKLIKDRYMLGLLAGFFASCLAVLIYLAFTIRSSELQIVVHYTSYGSTNFYRDKWYYLISFAVFILVMAITHSMIIHKLLETKGRELAIAFIYLSILMVFIAAALFYQVIKIASLS